MDICKYTEPESLFMAYYLNGDLLAGGFAFATSMPEAYECPLSSLSWSSPLASSPPQSPQGTLLTSDQYWEPLS